MAEVLDETLTTKEEITTHGKRQIERLIRGRVPKKRRSARRTASQAKEAAADASANGVPEHRPNAEQHPGNDGAAETGDSGAGKSGIERLIDAVDKALGEECQALTLKLAEKAKNGNDSAMKLLIMLAERKKPREVPKKKPIGLTYAQRLAVESSWKGDKPEQQAAEVSGPGELVKAGG